MKAKDATRIGTYNTMRLREQTREAGIWAAALTSLKMENLGPFACPITEVEALIRDHYDHRTSR